MRPAITVACLILAGCNQPKHYKLGDVSIKDLPVHASFWIVSSNGKGASTELTIEDFSKLGAIETTTMAQRPHTHVSIHLTNANEEYGRLLLKGWPTRAAGDQYGLDSSIMSTAGGEYTVLALPAGQDGYFDCPQNSSSSCVISLRRDGLWLTSSVNRNAIPSWSSVVAAYSRVIDQAVVASGG